MLGGFATKETLAKFEEDMEAAHRWWTMIKEKKPTSKSGTAGMASAEVCELPPVPAPTLVRVPAPTLAQPYVQAARKEAAEEVAKLDKLREAARQEATRATAGGPQSGPPYQAQPQAPAPFVPPEGQVLLSAEAAERTATELETLKQEMERREGELLTLKLKEAKQEGRNEVDGKLRPKEGTVSVSTIPHSCSHTSMPSSHVSSCLSRPTQMSIDELTNLKAGQAKALALAEANAAHEARLKEVQVCALPPLPFTLKP